MTNITFTHKFTFPEDKVKNFAIFLGWQEKLTRQIEVVDDDTTTPPTVHMEDEEYDNPETFSEYVDKLAKEHTLIFIKQWADKLKQDYVETQVAELKAQIEPVADDEIVKPVENALITSVE